MKTIRILVLLLFVLVSSTYLNAQLKVESSTGKVSIGSYNNLGAGLLKLGNDGVSDGISFYDSRNAGSPFYIYRSGDVAYLSRSSGSVRGLRMGNTGQVTIGRRAHDNVEPDGARFIVASPNPEVTFSVFGHPDMSVNSDIAKVQVYKDYHCAFAVWHYNTETNISRKTFFIDGGGRAWSNGQYITSDVTTKKNISTIISPLEKVMNLRGVIFDSKLESSDELPVMNRNVSDSVSTAISPVLIKQLNVEKKRKHMGVVAQEVEEIVPEVVRTTAEGTKAVAYHELVGLLIEAIKEQQEQIKEQQLQISDLKQQISPEAIIKNALVEDVVASMESQILSNNTLHQNTPNPFSSNTEIKYYLKDNIIKANLYIYDMQGRQMKNITNLSRGNNSITINSYELAPGMYIYTLIADGKEVGSKRMILTD